MMNTLEWDHFKWNYFNLTYTLVLSVLCLSFISNIHYKSQVHIYIYIYSSAEGILIFPFHRHMADSLRPCKWPMTCSIAGSTGFLSFPLESQQTPVLIRSINLIPAWIGNYIHFNMWVENTYPFQTSTLQPLSFGNGWVISSHTILDVWSVIHSGIWLNPYQ